MTTNQWREEFDKKFGSWIPNANKVRHSNYLLDVKSFIDSLLTSHRTAILAEIKGMKKDIKIVSSGTGKIDGHADFEAIAHNKVIDSIVQALLEDTSTKED